MFNSAAGGGQRSLLRLVNSSDAPVQATVTGLDDVGTASAEVSITVPAGAAEMLTAQELEDGGSRLEGGLGSGLGMWRLFVSADGPLTVMGLLEGPNGHLVNLSGTRHLDVAKVEVDVFGEGNVAVAEAPDALRCTTGTCEGTFTAGTRLVLGAEAEPGLNIEWSGCDGVSGSQCEIWADQDRSVSVAFQSSDPLALHENVIVLSEAQTDGLLAYDVETGRLLFDAATTGVSEWKAGDLLISEGSAYANDHRVPFALIIGSIESSGARALVHTSQASLEDIFESGAYSGTGGAGSASTAGVSGSSRWSSLAAPGGYRPYAVGTEVAPGVWYKGPSTAFGPVELSSNTLRFDVDAELAPGIRAKGTIDLLVSQEFRASFPAELRYVARTRTKAALQAIVDAGISFDNSKRLGLPVRLPRIQIGWIFLLPVLELEIPVRATIGAQAISPRVEMDIAATTGFHYLRGDVRFPYSSTIHDHDFDIGTMSAVVSATLETGLLGRMKLLLMGVAGPEATFSPFLGIDKCAWGDRATIYGGVRFTAGGRFSVLKRGYRIPLGTWEWSRQLGGQGLQADLDEDSFGHSWGDIDIGEAGDSEIWLDWAPREGSPVCGVSYDLYRQEQWSFVDRPRTDRIQRNSSPRDNGVKIGDGLKRTDYVDGGLTPGVLYEYSLVAKLSSSRDTEYLLFDAAEGRTFRRPKDRTGLAPGTRFRDCATCPEMVVIPPGTFTMGPGPWDIESFEYEMPAHRVTIDRPFAVSVYEITRDEYLACADEVSELAETFQYASARLPWSGWIWHHDLCDLDYSDRGKGHGRHPASPHAHTYLLWLSWKTGAHYRFLSEAEWEYAARAGTRTRFHTGNNISTRQANFGWQQWVSSGPALKPVGSYAPNAFGLYDMHGNASEVVADCWHNSYEGAPNDGRAWTWNCERPASAYLWGSPQRGGDASVRDTKYLRSASRLFPPPFGGPFGGLRIARSLVGDHGDSYDTATEVAVPSVTDGVSEHGYDRDYFRFVVPEGSRARLTLRGIFGDDLDDLDGRNISMGRDSYWVNEERGDDTFCYYDDESNPSQYRYVCDPGTHTIFVWMGETIHAMRDHDDSLGSLLFHAREYKLEIEIIE